LMLLACRIRLAFLCCKIAAFLAQMPTYIHACMHAHVDVTYLQDSSILSLLQNRCIPCTQEDSARTRNFSTHIDIVGMYVLDIDVLMGKLCHTVTCAHIYMRIRDISP
jgi:hypothetical protein